MILMYKSSFVERKIFEDFHSASIMSYSASIMSYSASVFYKTSFSKNFFALDTSVSVTVTFSVIVSHLEVK